MKYIVCLFVMVALTCGARATGQAGAGPSDIQEATKKLGVFVGKWESTGAFSDTKFSQAHKISSSIDCRWSPLGNFLMCEQSITDGTEKLIQLSIYSYNSKDGNYTISSMSGPGQQPFNGTVIIKGSLWTYPGGFERDGKKIEIRTTNDFSVAGTETFKTEFSEDGGAHWTTMLQGTSRKIAG
ncbi:MAG TPA: hypothetical protein VG488_04855 [Candidatus Angelobacter sp.]|nr:hypothetical protein [Candidatus Angelobacter sp.]